MPPQVQKMIGGLSPTPLPRRLSSFVGRQQEIQELRGVLARGRLLTLTGAGGCGKTRLGLELAARMSPDFEDGVAFADLAPVHDPVAVTEFIAAALGLEAPAACQIPALIGEASLLLVIDNAEHLIDPVSILAADYVARCQNLHILVTSRELLNVEGERSWRVPQLSVPPSDTARDSRAVGSYDAVRLFLARVAEHQPSFRLSDTNAPLVTDICRRLDGIPLALELAAARVRSLALTDMAKRLDDSFSLLTRGPRTTLSRHRSLRATIGWSYLLLDEREQRLLRRLSVFADVCDLTAVEAVCSAPDLPPEEIADSLHRLADKSLVTTEPGSDGSLRYRQLEVIRQYGRDRLLAAGEADFTARHGRYYASLVHLLSAGDRAVNVRTEAMTAHYGNVQIAMSWAAAADPELEMTMVEEQQWFWVLRGAVREARERIRSVLTKEHIRGPRLARLYVLGAKWSWLAGDLQAAVELIDQAAELFEEESHPRLACWMLNMRGLLAYQTDDLATAERHYFRSVKLCEESQRTGTVNPPHQPDADLLPTWQQDLAVSLNNVALVHVGMGRAEDALREAERARDTLIEVPEWRLRGVLASFLDTLGSALLALDRVSEARDQFLHALRHAAGDDSNQAAVAPLRGLACTAAGEGRHVACLTLLAAAQRAALISGTADRKQVTPHREAERRSRATLGDEGSAAAWEQGLRLDLKAAVAFARANCVEPVSPLLTPLKIQIVRLVAAGFSDKEIARRRSISTRTVEAHLLQIRHQLGFHNRAQIAAWAASTGLLRDESTMPIVPAAQHEDGRAQRAQP